MAALFVIYTHVNSSKCVIKTASCFIVCEPAAQNSTEYLSVQSAKALKLIMFSEVATVWQRHPNSRVECMTGLFCWIPCMHLPHPAFLFRLSLTFSFSVTRDMNTRRSLTSAVANVFRRNVLLSRQITAHIWLRSVLQNIHESMFYGIHFWQTPGLKCHVCSFTCDLDSASPHRSTILIYPLMISVYSIPVRKTTESLSLRKLWLLVLLLTPWIVSLWVYLTPTSDTPLNLTHNLTRVSFLQGTETTDANGCCKSCKSTESC